MDDFKTFYEKFTKGELMPTNRRRKMLLESQYIYPSNGDKAVMDLYALYTLWWDLGAGKEAAGYQQMNIRSHKVTERVNRYFEEALVTISNILLEESKKAIEDEAENVFDEHLIPSESVVAWFKENNLLPKLAKAYNGGAGGKWFGSFSYGDTLDVFNAPFWEEHANLYGGEKWANITDAVRKLDNAIRRENVQNLMYIFDRLMDLEHNTGSLSSKLQKMKVSKETLDLRAGFKSIEEFRPYVSPQVEKLIGLTNR